MKTTLREAAVEKLREGLAAASYSYTGGATHAFYHYPARFSPQVARAVIEIFSRRNDVVLDPFMGGGTGIIEGLMLGRRMVGVDLNALACFVTDVRTRPLSTQDEDALRTWAEEAARDFGGPLTEDVDIPGIENLPRAVEVFMAGSSDLSDKLEFRRQQTFARCALLRLGQWVLDCRDFVSPRRKQLANRLPVLVDEMIAGLHEFVENCRDVDVAKNEIAGRRTLLHRSAVGLDRERGLLHLDRRPNLVFTSPPYPSVHVLYHRWQYRGRRETPAPYWIARVPDGFYESYYTGGSRTPTGRRNYFNMIRSAFTSVRGVVSPKAMVVQLVGFSDTATQLPLYLEAMDEAGFDEWTPTLAERETLVRRVPNRKWYARLQGALDASTELLLFHTPR
ncbi:MAG: DNA methyltransferase [Polyangiaceae bacterium]